MDKPKYEHDCPFCKFRGNREGYDMYFCTKSKTGGGTILARYGDAPHEYYSSLLSIEFRRCREGDSVVDLWGMAMQEEAKVIMVQTERA